MAKVALQKYRLTQAQLRSLTMAERPELDANGKVVFVPNEKGEPYRFVDDTPGAPAGFGFYVGPTGVFYELRMQYRGVRRRLALGSVQELTLARAHELAGAQRHHIRQTGEDPRERIRIETERQQAKGTTVGDALRAYLAHLEDKLARGKAKKGGVEGVRDSLMRLEREEVGLAKKAIAGLADKDILNAWNALRHSCMQQSNRLSLQIVSWVWLAPKPDAKNPTTGLRGSQVFFHDTKNGQIQLLPVAYFAERILRWRFDDSYMKERALTRELAKAKREGDKQRVAHIEWQLANLARWVFPARNPKSKEGHHTDSKAILHNVRLDAGLLDPKRGIDIGLTPHDLRRTLGRFAGKLLPGHVVSQLLNHHSDQDGGGKMAKVTERYSKQEWPALQEAMDKVEGAMIATSPRVWNILKGPDRPMLDEIRDPPLNLPSRRALGHRSKAHTAGSKGSAGPAASESRRARQGGH